MKKLLCICLALILLFVTGILCGCNRNQPKAPSETEAPTAKITTPSAGLDPAEPSAPSSAPIESKIPQTVTAYTGKPLLEADPEREVYISLANQDCDFYPDSPISGVTFRIITKEPYTAPLIKVKIPMQSDYQVAVFDASEDYQQTLDLGHYLCLQKDTDWQELGQMLLDSMNANSSYDKHIRNGGSPVDEEAQNYEAITQRYIEKTTQLQAQCEAAPEEEIPTFYVYSVTVIFVGAADPKAKLCDETVETLDVVLGGETYSVNFGQWRFHTQKPDVLEAKGNGLRQAMIATLSIVDSPYNGGYVRLLDALSFYTKKDVTVLGVRTYGAEIGILGARVTAQGTEAANAVDFFWDMQRPLYFDAGQDVSITIYLRDDRFTQFETGCTMHLIMDYEVNGKSYTMVEPCCLQRYNNPWDGYLLAFEGRDVGAYYHYLYTPEYENYMWELPENWRN